MVECTFNCTILDLLNCCIDVPLCPQVRAIANFGGSSVKQAVEEAGKRLMLPELTVKYNMLGRKGKLSFNSLADIKGTMLGKKLVSNMFKIRTIKSFHLFVKICENEKDPLTMEGDWLLQRQILHRQDRNFSHNSRSVANLTARL